MAQQRDILGAAPPTYGGTGISPHQLRQQQLTSLQGGAQFNPSNFPSQQQTQQQPSPTRTIVAQQRLTQSIDPTHSTQSTQPHHLHQPSPLTQTHPNLQYQHLMTQQMMKSSASTPSNAAHTPYQIPSPNQIANTNMNGLTPQQQYFLQLQQQQQRQHQQRQHQQRINAATAATAKATTSAAAFATNPHLQQRVHLNHQQLATNTSRHTAKPTNNQYIPSPYNTAIARQNNPLQQQQTQNIMTTATPQQSAQYLPTTNTTITPTATAATAATAATVATSATAATQNAYLPTSNQPQIKTQQQQQTQQTQQVQQVQPAQQAQQIVANKPAAAPLQTGPPSTTPQTNSTEQSAVDTLSQSSNANTFTPYSQFTKPSYPVLPDRKYLEITRAQYHDPLRNVKVVSFNVMPKGADFKNKLQRGDALQGYRTRPNYYSWGRRGPLLIEEIRKGQPDIICLQGCDQFDYFQEKLAPRGFVGVYERTQQPLEMKNVYFGDGLAIFWRTEKFELSGRQKYLLGDNRFISNIALLARLKRRSPFIDPLNMNFLLNPLHIRYEQYLICKSYSEEQQFWAVLSTKYLYLFKEKQHYVNPIKYFDINTFERIRKSSINEVSFTLYSKPQHIQHNKTNPNDDDDKKGIEFVSQNANNNLLWFKHIKDAQIGIEIDVWNSHLLHGHSSKAEYRRVKQAEILFECMAKASAQSNLKNRNIGSEYNPYAPSNSYQFYQDVLDAKAMQMDNINNKQNDKRKNNKKKEQNLSELFKKLMEKRISDQQLTQIPIQTEPVIIDPNIKQDRETDDDDDDKKEEKENDDDGGSTPIGLSLDPIKSSSFKPTTNGATIINNESDDDSVSFEIPTQLHRPVILCIDIESNANGDYNYQILPLVYSYLTMKSRTTQNNQLYGYSTKTLQNDPSCVTDRHSWFLQSAYALGFGDEPELTSFNRYWPHEISSESDLYSSFKNNITAQSKKIDFADSIEIAKCSDLILFSPQHFRVLKLLQPIDKQWILSKWNKTLPNIDYPSDHSMIGVEFELAIPNFSMPANPNTIRSAPTTPNITGLSSTIATTPTPSSSKGARTPIISATAPSMALSTIPNRQYTPNTGTPGSTNNPYYSPFAHVTQKYGNQAFQRK